jgi:hypothetical protein
MEARLKRLEWLNRVLFAGLALAVLPWLVAAAAKVPELVQGNKGKSDTVEAKQFVVIDDAGNKMVSVEGHKDTVGLRVMDAKGETRMFVGLHEGNPSLLFAKKNGNIMASFVEKDGSFITIE